jgi:hypothetical protein
VSRRLAPLASAFLLALAVAPAHAADPPPAGGGSVTGVAYQDTNGDGAGPQEGETLLAGWVVWADLDGNGAREAGEPSASAGADGRYALGPLAPGDYTLRIQEPDGTACPATATCARLVTVAEGAQATADFPLVLASEPPRQLIDEEPVRIGPFKLTARRSCARRPFKATLTGSGVYRADFRIDGRLVRSMRNSHQAKRFSVRVVPRRLRPGVHTLAVSLWFSEHATAPGKRLSAKFRICARHG